MIDVRRFNREAWDKQVQDGNRWTISISRAGIDRVR